MTAVRALLVLAILVGALVAPAAAQDDSARAKAEFDAIGVRGRC